MTSSGDAIDILFSFLREKSAKGEYPLTFWVEMRVMATSDVYLSPAVVGKHIDGAILFAEYFSRLVTEAPNLDKSCF